MKKYSLVTRWVSDQPDIQCNFDTLEELFRDPIVKAASDAPYFYRLSIAIESVLSYRTPNYSIFNLFAEYHDGYVHETLGHLIRHPIDQLNHGFPTGANTCPANCGDFNPSKELGIPLFDYYGWIVYKLIGGEGARVVEGLMKGNDPIDMIKKFIELEIQYQSIHPPQYPKIKSVLNTNK